MEQGFINILQKLISEQGKEALLNESKCKALLTDYTNDAFKKESRLLFQVLKAGVQRAIDTTQELANCKKQQVRLLHDDYGLDEKLAADIVNALALVLRGDTASEETQAAFEKDNDKSIGPAPNTYNDYTNRGYANFWKGQYDQAIIEFNEAIRLDPNNAVAYSVRGDAYKSKGQYDRAIGDYTEAIRLDPNNVTSYLSRGITYCVKDQKDKAILDFNEAIKIDPNNEIAKNALQEIQEQFN